MTVEKSKKLFEIAKRSFAGGVGSPRRAEVPIYVERGKGSRVWDVDGNEYIDYLLSFGPLILGHSHPSIIAAIKEQIEKGTMFACANELEIKVSQKIKEHVPCANLVRFANSGSEVCHIIMRLARAYTGKSKIIKFEGHYHGWYDGALINVHTAATALGSRLDPWKIRGSQGIPESVLNDIIIIPWNDLDLLNRIVSRHKDEVAAIITEPVLCNSGGIPPEDGYLKGMRELTEENDMLLLFDEIVTGFRLAMGGAQEYYGVVPDLAAFSKGFGGGVPVSAYAGREDIMEMIADERVYQAGTYNSNPLCLSACLATLTELEKNDEEAFRHLHRIGRRISDGMRDIIERKSIEALVLGMGPFFQIHFTKLKKLRDFRDVCSEDQSKAKSLREELFERGVIVNPSYWGVWYVSTAHTDDDVNQTLTIFEDSIKATFHKDET